MEPILCNPCLRVAASATQPVAPDQSPSERQPTPYHRKHIFLAGGGPPLPPPHPARVSARLMGRSRVAPMAAKRNRCTLAGSRREIPGDQQADIVTVPTDSVHNLGIRKPVCRQCSLKASPNCAASMDSSFLALIQ